MLKLFKIDRKRDLLYPELRCYQADMMGPVNLAIERGEIKNPDESPSIQKFCANPARNKGFWTILFESLFLGRHGFDELNMDYQLCPDKKVPRIAMMFLPANIRVEALRYIASIAEETLPFEIVLLTGKEVKNADAEGKSKAKVEQAQKEGKSILFLSAQIAQRSFSIPEITELYLTYDKGSAGSTIQKMSRVLTPATSDKVGRVISLSFDPNRDDKLDSFVLEAAINLHAQKAKKSFPEYIKDVLKVVHIANCTEHGATNFEIDDYLQKIMARGSLGKAIGAMTDLTKIDASTYEELASAKNGYSNSEKVDASHLGKVKPSVKKMKGKASKILNDKQAQRVREAIATLCNNIHILILGTPKSETLKDAFKYVSEHKQFQEYVKQEFGMSFASIQSLFETGAVNEKWIQIRYDKVIN